MRTIAVDSLAPDPAVIAEAARILAAGGLAAFPTETFYGLGADPWSARGLEALFRAKGRPADMPILLLLADASQAAQASGDLPAALDLLARRFWPGPLTLVVPASDALPVHVTAGTGTVGVRVPSAAIPRALARALGRPVTGTSANRTGAPATRLASEVAATLGACGALDLLLDGGDAPGGAPSTVVDLTQPAPRLIRDGAVPFEAVRSALGGAV